MICQYKITIYKYINVKNDPQKKNVSEVGHDRLRHRYES